MWNIVYPVLSECKMSNVKFYKKSAETRYASW